MKVYEWFYQRISADDLFPRKQERNNTTEQFIASTYIHMKYFFIHDNFIKTSYKINEM